MTALATLLLVAPWAQADHGGDEGYRYQGAYWALQAHSGLVTRAAPLPGETPGPLYGVSFRLASLLSLADVQASFLGSVYRTRAPDGRSVGVARWSLGIEAHAHPFMITILRNTTLWYWIAGLYGAAGVDLDLTRLTPRGAPGRTEADFGWHIGAGSDFPVTDPNEGWGLWVGVQYKLRFLDVHPRDLGLGSFDEHLLLVTVGYRDNDVFFARAPRPDELRYRDPPVPHE